jgi:UDP-glucose:(glucosyl)LPS alpha-1,2-glucosyltransferase
MKRYRMGFDVNEISAKSKGGTELMRIGLEQRLDPKLLEDFQIIPSRVRELREDKIRVYWLHDLPEDPETRHLREAESRQRFHHLVFCNEWQYTRYRDYLQVPHNETCSVIDNAVTPFESVIKSTDEVRLVYISTPQRGLEILVPVFERLAEKHSNIVLDVFSSFSIYGWEDPPKFKELFEKCKAHPKINYHGSQPHEVVREALKKAHILAYPSIWMECNSLSVIESMSAGLLCVHPNYAGLVDTSGGLNFQYQWNDNANKHAHNFYSALDNAIEVVNKEEVQNYLKLVKVYADSRFNWDKIASKWTDLLEHLKRTHPADKRAIKTGGIFQYNAG